MAFLKGLRLSGVWGARQGAERTSPKGLGLPGAREASERTSFKGLRLQSVQGGCESSDKTSIRGLRSRDMLTAQVQGPSLRCPGAMVSCLEIKAMGQALLHRRPTVGDVQYACRAVWSI